MPSIVGYGDRIITAGGRASWLKRGSVPMQSYYNQGAIRLTGDGVSISYDRLYREQPWVKVCVDKLAHQIATLPLKAYSLGSQNERERVTEHPLVELLRKPWPRGRSVHLKQKIAFPALLHGNSVLTKERVGGGVPVGLKPRDWRYLVPRLNDLGELEVWEDQRRGEFVAPDDTLHFHWENPDGWCGTSPLQPLGVTVRLEDAAQRHATSAFHNGVQPNMALVLDKDAPYNDEIRRQLREEVTAQHGGPDRSGGVFIAGGGATVETLSHTAKEAELIEQRKLNREEVAAVYDVPPPMVGILDKATYSNITEQHKMLYMTVLRPWLVLIEETFEAHLIDGVPSFEGVFLEFDLAEVLKGDAKERADAFKVFLEAGVYTINELRKLENLPRIEHPLADRPLIPANNMQPIDQVAPDSDPRGVAPVLSSHLARARDRVLTKNGAGAGDLLDGDRFERELGEDLEQKLNGSAGPFAAIWRAALEQGVTDAGQDRDRIKNFFQALGA